MDKLRGIFAKIFVFILFGLLILSFAIWGIGDMLRGGSGDAVVASVGDRKISEPEYRRAFARTYSNLQQRFGGAFDVEMARSLAVPQQVLQQLLDTAAFENKVEDLGMVVTDEQVRDAILAQPAFQNEAGRFDRLRYEQVLRNNQLSEGQFVEILRKDIAREQIVSALAAAAKAPEVLTEALFRYGEEKRVADYILISLVSLPETAPPSDEVLAQFYQDYADSFRAPEYRSLTYLYLKPADFEGEVTVDDEELRRIYDLRQDELGKPERRGLQQMLFETEEAAQAALERLRSGQSFASVAEETTGKAPVDLGVVEAKQLVDEVAAAAFAVQQGEVAGPVESPFGWHLLYVTSLEPAYMPSFEEVRDRLLAEARSAQALDSLIAVANQLDDSLAGGARLEEAADRLALTVHKVDAVDAEGNDQAGQAVSDLPDRNRFLATAFETEAGADSLLIETAAAGYFVLRVDSVIPPAVRPLEEVRDRVRELWIQQERERVAREQAEALAERLRGAETLAALAQELDTSVLTTAPVTRTERDPAKTPSAELSASLFQIQPEDVTISGTPLGPVVARLKQVIEPDPSGDKAALDQIAERTTQGLRADLLTLYTEALKARYGVQVNQQQIDSIVLSF